MPAYEYLCDECSCHFEKRQKMSEAAVEQCPECGGHVKPHQRRSRSHHQRSKPAHGAAVRGRPMLRRRHVRLL